MAPYFFRVEHDLLRSESFKTLGGSAIKVYLVIGLYSDFGTDWAYPSIRTIARQAGLSRQTVLVAVEDLTRLGLLATSKSKGRSTAYKIIRQAAGPPARHEQEGEKSGQRRGETGPESFRGSGLTVPDSLGPTPGNWSRFCSRRWPSSSAWQAPRLGPNKNQEREKKRRASRFRERPSASPPKGGCSLLLICKNC